VPRILFLPIFPFFFKARFQNFTDAVPAESQESLADEFCAVEAAKLNHIVAEVNLS
jgi:hypothetical protein